MSILDYEKLAQRMTSDDFREFIEAYVKAGYEELLSMDLGSPGSFDDYKNEFSHTVTRIIARLK